MSRLYYDNPSNGDWNKALPIGNGMMGAMIFGERNSEHIQLNEESVWAGGPINRNNPDAYANLGKLQKLILEERIEEAERLLKYAFSGTPQSMGPYQTLGDIYMDFHGLLDNVSHYYRELSLDDAVHTVETTEEQTGITITREMFASYPAGCIVGNIKINQPGRLSFSASLLRECFYDWTVHNEDTVLLGGTTDGKGVEYCVGIKLIPLGGSVEAQGEHVIVTNADEAIILVAAATTFRESNPRLAVQNKLDRISLCSYQQLREEHIRDYQSLFLRAGIRFPQESLLDKLPINERLKRVSEQNPDNGLVSIYYDFGRYLLIASSRPGTLPANLQGIWNREFTPAWQSKYTININAEMNYWPACSCNLAECEEPLFDLLKRMKPKGEETAEAMYGCRGFVAHHNTNIWGDCAPQDICISATYWVMGAAWLCTHIWKHYMYTKDQKFLEDMYPVLKSAATFFLDFMIEVDGYLVTCPSISPENTYIMDDGSVGRICAGATMDIELLNDLFTQVLRSGEIVGEEDALFLEQIRQHQLKLPPIRIGKYGQIMEWNKDYEEYEPGHRHISHLYALYPSDQITVDGTPELAEAARVTLERRLASGGGHTGWSRAWIMNMYAALWDGDKTYENLIALFKCSTLENLFDNHPPFQIDGNFGSVAAIANMFLQSTEERCCILPAIPKQMPEGRVYGLVAVGGATYEIVWSANELETVTVEASKDYNTILKYRENKYPLCMKQGEIITIQQGQIVQ